MKEEIWTLQASQVRRHIHFWNVQYVLTDLHQVTRLFFADQRHLPKPERNNPPVKSLKAWIDPQGLNKTAIGVWWWYFRPSRHCAHLDLDQDMNLQYIVGSTSSFHVFLRTNLFSISLLCVCVCVCVFACWTLRRSWYPRSRTGSSLSFEGSGWRLADLYGNVGVERIFLHRHHSVHQRADPIFPHGVLSVLDLIEPGERRRNASSISCAMVFRNTKLDDSSHKSMFLYNDSIDWFSFKKHKSSANEP